MSARRRLNPAAKRLAKLRRNMRNDSLDDRQYRLQQSLLADLERSGLGPDDMGPEGVELVASDEELFGPNLGRDYTRSCYKIFF